MKNPEMMNHAELVQHVRDLNRMIERMKSQIVKALDAVVDERKRAGTTAPASTRNSAA